MSEAPICRGEKLHLVLLGAPGAGKGTQAAFLKDNWGLIHLSTGDILRAELRDGTALGIEARGYMERGELAPDDLIIRMMEGRIKTLGESGYVLDGFPRTEAQAAALDALLARIGQTLDAVVNIEVPNPELIRRLTGRRVCPQCGAVYHVDTMPPKKVAGECDLCGSALVQRNDDQLDAIANRLDVYQVQTQPLIAYYRERGKLLTIDGTIGVPQVAAELRAALCGGA